MKLETAYSPSPKSLLQLKGMFAYDHEAVNLLSGHCTTPSAAVLNILYKRLYIYKLTSKVKKWRNYKSSKETKPSKEQAVSNEKSPTFPLGCPDNSKCSTEIFDLGQSKMILLPMN
ncbi:hypothetical protein ACFX1Q_003572 [Malus domestica]